MSSHNFCNRIENTVLHNCHWESMSTEVGTENTYAFVVLGEKTIDTFENNCFNEETATDTGRNKCRSSSVY